MSGVKEKSMSQVKSINDLKKVLPKVKILGAEASTLKELTKDNTHNRYIMEKPTRNIDDPKEQLNNYCRTCAGLKIHLVDIFSEKGIQMRLSQQMKHLESIDKYDSLSTQMCMDCICDLKMSYKFFMQIKKAQVKLKSIYASKTTDNKNIQSINVNSKYEKISIVTESNQKQLLPLSVSPQSTTGQITYSIDIPVTNKIEEQYVSDNESIEEFDPDDHHLIPDISDVEESDEAKNNHEDIINNGVNMENCKIKHEESPILSVDISTDNTKDQTVYEYDTEHNTYVKLQPDIVIDDTAPQLQPEITSISSVDNTIIKEGLKQPNILKRKASQLKSAEIKEAKIHKLNTVNISPSDEQGIMYVTVKGSKPNEMLLVKVKKMDKPGEKKDDKAAVNKCLDLKPVEKNMKNIPYKDADDNDNNSHDNDSPKKIESREAIIEKQIEQYKKKREMILGGSANVREAIKYDDGSVRFVNPSSTLSFHEQSALKVAPIDHNNDDDQTITANDNIAADTDIDADNDVAENGHEATRESLKQLAIIKQKLEEAKVKKVTLQREFDESYTEKNLEKLARILGEKEQNLQDFQEYLKQRKIVITRLKDEDIISLYEDRNTATINKKFPDLIDENPAVDAIIGEGNFLDCDYCPQIFSSRETLEEHLKNHDYRLLYYCEDCSSQFTTNKARRAHNITCLKKLICKYCDFMLESKGKKRQHEQKHCDAIYGQLCDVCGEKFKHQGTLDQHIKTQHMSWEKVFQCPKCPKKFAFKQKLSFHLKSVHTTLRAYLCEDCGADFKNPASLRHHRIRKHQPTGNKRECPVCHKLVPFYSLSKHMYTHKAYTIQCPHCDKMFKNTSTLKQHVRIHEDQRQYRCDTCGVGFNRRDGLRLHMRVHQKSGSRALKECSCQICSEKFPNHSMLVIHRNRVHKDGRQYTCNICNRSMLSTRSLEWHMSHIHNQTPPGISKDEAEAAPEKKRVSCSHCNKTFKTEMILRTHIKNTHMEKNPVKCLDCELSFTSEVRLRHHMMITHNRLEGTLICPHCPKRFVNQLRLKTHMISHSEDRPYTCEICGFNLKTKIQLIKHHQNRHSDERPLQCRYCSWRCKQVSALVCHERTHTNERPYACIVCKQRFKYLGDKNKHERRHESLGGSGFKRIVAGRNIKNSTRNREAETSASEQDLLEPENEYETIEAHLADEQYDQLETKFEEEEQIIKYESQDIAEEEEDDDDDEDEEEYEQTYEQEYEETSTEASDAAQVIMSMEDATVYTEEVTADNIETVEMITDEIITNQILQAGTVVHLQQQDENGKIQVIPVMLSLPDLTDSSAEVTLETASIML